MHIPSLQIIPLIVTIGFISSTIYAADEHVNLNQLEQFKSVCVKAWMERADDITDKSNFRNFGEKYCQCAANKTFKNQKDFKRTAQTCISETLLHNAMNMLEDKQGFSNISTSGIETACQNEFKLAFPKMSEETKQASITYCECAAPKLNDLIKNRRTLADTQWIEKMDAIADNCAILITLGNSTEPAK